MKLRFLFAFLCCSLLCDAQTLTVEKIMQDPKWIGTQPDDITWSVDGKFIYFKWNPDKQISDSNYRYNIATGQIEKANYNEVQKVTAMQRGRYNNSRTQLLYEFNGDVFLYDIKSATTRRVTQTADAETDPQFVAMDKAIAYSSGGNLYTWNISNGSTEQLTSFSKAAATAPATTGRAGGRNANTDSSKTSKTTNATALQDKWLEEDQLMTSDVIKMRKEKADAQKAFLKRVKETDTLRTIAIGEKSLIRLQVSPTADYITYVLQTAATAPSKRTIIPNYVTESGFTTDINGRTNVGNAQGTYEFFMFDRLRDTVYAIATDSLPGITTFPDYYKDYPEKYKNVKPTARKLSFGTPVWNAKGSKAVIDIRSQDYKDRWLMILDPATGKLSLADHQRDEAWIAGPGIESGRGGLGWITEDVLYYQSEATGYSHLYTYNASTGKKAQLTSGKFEVQDRKLSIDKQHFFVLLNDEHPGKQNWYRIGLTGSKEKITSMTGGYEVVMSPDEKAIAYRYSSSNKPWELYLQANEPGKAAKQLTNKAMSDEWKAYPWRIPAVVEIPARDGSTIYARLYEPEPSKKNGAAVIFVHGAGYLQNVHFWWSQYFREYMFNNLLTDMGYTVIDADYRASSGYGRNWRTGIYRYMGDKDMTDNIDAINWLIKNKSIDGDRVGMYGGSYGGFMTLMTMFTAPDVLKAGAALRPVTDWAHYNHEYTARILNEPFTDSIAYARSSPINFAAGLKNNLLICHGMVDVNVHFQDAVRLTQRLIELGKDNWSIAPYPVEDHGFVEPSSWTDEYKRIMKLFNSTLLKQ